MRPTRPLVSPVITLLSPSPSASRRAQEILGNVFGLQEVEDRSSSGSAEDELNAKMQSPLSAISSMNWDSVVSQCPNSGALVHWLSPDNATDARKGSFSLLGVTNRANKDDCSKSARRILASHFPNSILTLRLRHFLQRPITVDALLKRHQGLPVLDLPTVEESPSAKDTPTSSNNGPRLKEVAFTIYDDAVYEDGSSVFSKLSQSALLRPVTGLYGYGRENGIRLRPLPAAQQDLKRSPRPLVLTFHTENLEEISSNSSASTIEEGSIQFSKIGFTGQGNGQLRVQVASGSTNPLNGLDVRWCEQVKPTSVFPEAQESLLASSLPELQSADVLKSTGKSEPGAEDARIGSSDCWVEVRTMVKNPRGFVSSKRPKVATAPPSYPE